MRDKRDTKENIIYSYTRDDAIEDGVFLDVTPHFLTAGKKLNIKFKESYEKDLTVVITQDISAELHDASADKIEFDKLLGKLLTAAIIQLRALKPDNLYTDCYFKFSGEIKNFWVADENGGLNIFFPYEY